MSTKALSYAESVLLITNKQKRNKLDPSVCSVFLMLAWRSNDAEWSTYVGRTRIASVCGLSVPTVSEAFAKLVDLELIQVNKRPGTTNIIKIIDHNLDHLNTHYPEYAAVFPELRQLNSVARLFGICAWRWVTKSGTCWAAPTERGLA